ncbi:hypothetical protein V8B55DRAFT_1579282 [Mucor lusitanicus]|uniref:Uncharacterized protein n=1 Tax=Mucor lusitanicus CBS 277.49 TaxID=747725 RepID=A0A162MUU1_MUCCL|nr:hypothetical protein MUCCIDRAFT_106254 [Mucor lusitanicus CBS 277.49]
MKQNLKHVHDRHRKDLLYYHIIDLVTSSKKQAVYQALNDAQIQHKRKQTIHGCSQRHQGTSNALPDATPLTILKQAACKMTKVYGVYIFYQTQQQLPAFLSLLLNLPRLYSEMVSRIDAFLEASSGHGVPSHSNSEALTPDVLPKKPKQKSSRVQ